MKPLTLEEAAALPLSSVGGKAGGLSRLAAMGLRVPPARVLPVDAHRRFVELGALDVELRDALAAAAADLRYPLAVRSSGANEDLVGKSAAGQYESVMGVMGRDGLYAAAERCYAAAASDRVRVYQQGDPGGLALVIQEQVESQRAGVAFSIDPVSGSSVAVIIEAVFGHGEGLVSGSLAPDRYAVGRPGAAVRARRVRKAQLANGTGALTDVNDERRLTRVMRDDEARRVAELVLVAERGFDTPVDVEFCWAADELWLVQCRPITTIAAVA
jgi:phosphoenolpyruvate synthase/pyruvate phosphate dikinase